MKETPTKVQPKYFDCIDSGPVVSSRSVAPLSSSSAPLLAQQHWVAWVRKEQETYEKSVAEPTAWKSEALHPCWGILTHIRCMFLFYTVKDIREVPRGKTRERNGHEGTHNGDTRRKTNKKHTQRMTETGGMGTMFFILTNHPAASVSPLAV